MLQEYVNGQLKNKYGDAFIRGNNGEWTWTGRLLETPKQLISLEFDLQCANVVLSA